MSATKGWPKIGLEDDPSDLLRKASRGAKLDPSALGHRTGIEPAAISAWLNRSGKIRKPSRSKRANCAAVSSMVSSCRTLVDGISQPAEPGVNPGWATFTQGRLTLLRGPPF